MVPSQFFTAKRGKFESRLDITNQWDAQNLIKENCEVNENVFNVNSIGCVDACKQKHKIHSII
jgi:hypothetical protein